MAQFDLSRYDTVADRIKQFRDKHPDGAIIVTLLSDPAQFEQVVCRAEIFLDKNDARPIAADIASEWKGQSFKDGANFTAWHENCATGAIGRALDAAGFSKAKEGGRASREEMEKVNRHAETPANAPTHPVQQANPANLHVSITGWGRFVDRCTQFRFSTSSHNNNLDLVEELLKDIDTTGLSDDEFWGLAAGENDLAWESAIEALRAKKQANSRKAVTA